MLELAQKSRGQLKALQRELGEISVLIKQTSSEIERLAPRAAESNRRMREIDANMDHLSRQELREILTSAQDSEMRLFVMRGQLETLEHKERTLERLRAVLQSIVDVATTVGVGDQSPADNEPAVGEYTGGPASPGSEIVAKIMQAQENERQRIARQLHDGPAQSLTNLILRAEICQRMLDFNPDDARSELSSLKTMVVNALQETRAFIFDLRPMILDDLGLMPTLRRQAEIFSSQRHIPVHLSLTGVERRLPPPVEVAVFRVVQEALDNAARHGKASQIEVSVELANDDITVTIEDNGAGFDINKVMASNRQRKALGFRGVQQQVSAVGGQLHFESFPGRGSKVTVRVSG